MKLLLQLSPIALLHKLFVWALIRSLLTLATQSSKLAQHHTQSALSSEILVHAFWILTLCALFYTHRPVSPDLALSGIGVSNAGFEDIDAPLKVEHSSPDVEKRQEPEGQQKSNADSKLKDSPEEQLRQSSHL